MSEAYGKGSHPMIRLIFNTMLESVICCSREAVTKIAPTVAVVVLLLSVMTMDASARAGDSGDIQARLDRWTEDFNAGRTEDVCDLFSRDVIASFRGQPERDYTAVCELLQTSLTDPQREFHYDLEVHEIIVEGTLAVVRLTWTLSVMPDDVTSVEPGIDVFRKEADGKWRIIRYLAFEAP